MLWHDLAVCDGDVKSPFVLRFVEPRLVHSVLHGLLGQAFPAWTCFCRYNSDAPARGRHTKRCQ